MAESKKKVKYEAEDAEGNKVKEEYEAETEDSSTATEDERYNAASGN